MSEDFDLFGVPIIPQEETRGRPEHQPNDRIRNKINVLVSLGWSKERISEAVGISKPTMNKYYFSDDMLTDNQSVAKDRLFASIIEKLLNDFQETSNVSSAKAFISLFQQSSLPNVDNELTETSVNKSQQKKLGKKQQRLEDAKNAGADSHWGSDLDGLGGNVIN